MSIFLLLMLILYIVYDNAKAKEKVRKYHEDDAQKYGKGRNWYDQYVYTQLIEEDLDRQYTVVWRELHEKKMQLLKDFDAGKISQETLNFQLQKLEVDNDNLLRSLTDGKMTSINSYAYGMARLWAYREGYIPIDMEQRPESEKAFDPFEGRVQGNDEYYLMKELMQPSGVPNHDEMEAVTERRLKQYREDLAKKCRGEAQNQKSQYTGTNQEYYLLAQRLVNAIEQEWKHRLSTST